jgi:phospholipid-binding lipoprotein MlaA
MRLNSPFHRLLRTGALALVAVWLAGCASLVSDPNHPVDPFEPLNRKVMSFNDDLDKAVIKPVAVAYRDHMPRPVRHGVSNVLGNIADVWISFNNFLQGKGGDGLSDVGRVLVNTTIGIGGLFDVASEMGLEKHAEDFGQTLGVWGVPAGPYLVMPFLGSTNPRDLVGTGVTIVLNPLNYANFDGDDGVRVGSRVLGAFSGRESAIETIENIRATQVDPYVTVRRFYVRNRAAEIGNIELSPEEIQNVPEYELDF